MKKRLYAAFFAAGLAVMGAADAHCDTMDGPVVGAARAALDTGNINEVRFWVSKDNESELNAAFKETLAVRKLNVAARSLADRAFFETVVRLHRLGEGAPYTGLKPAGSELGAAIPAADKAIETGKLDGVSSLLDQATLAGLREKFERVQAKKTFDKNDVAAGRAYVEAYVEYVHYVERVYEAAGTPAHDVHAGAEHAH